ncbi:MAG: VWA domain-containing protein [Hyphomicrobium sp.]|uniref:vWA domain-containing protein n=1 Tax=Hyphomicrobium sp. TaxID=82 RepID=UPI003D1022BE
MRSSARAVGLAGALVLGSLPAPAPAADDVRCLDDAMLVFDASGSMAGTDMNEVRPHIAKVREALAAVLPSVVSRRHLGLMVYGPGARPKCQNVELRLKPGANSAETIMGEVNGLVPAGQTPLTSAVRGAAEELNFREKPAVVVLLTDGEETCGGDPCRLARELSAEASALTIHVIAFKVRGETWLAPGSGSACMAEETGGLAITAQDKDELIAALQKTLTCPLFSEARASVIPGEVSKASETRNPAEELSKMQKN